MPGARRRTANPASVLDQGLQPRLLPGGDGCGTGHLIHESQGEQRPQSAAHRCRLWQRAPACKASWVSACAGAGRRGLIRRRAQVNPVVQPFSDTATWATKDSSEGVQLATHAVIGWSDASAAGAAA